MRVFTDDDLKRLKEGLEVFVTYTGQKLLIPKSDMEALIARLEAAEKFCSPHPSCNCAQECDYHSEAMKEWLKASGRDRDELSSHIE